MLRFQSLVQGIVGELFVPDNRPRQDQQFGATEACRVSRELDCLKADFQSSHEAPRSSLRVLASN
jgi:hypothetical protein